MTWEYLEQITAERLRELLSYDPETGEFRWLVSPNRRIRVGSVAGCVRPDGYRQIRIDGRLYLAQRLAWFYETGAWPADEIDHDNGIPGEDRWENLRDATHAENMRNSRKRRDNTSGAKGVTWNKGVSKWQAQIRVNRRYIHLGLFTDINEAAAAYAAASERLHGEFGRTA